jgi:hypothetical protein
MGVWQVTTGSFNSIVNINSCIRSIVAKYGRAHALPLVLERRPQETTYKGKKATHYTLHINTDKSLGEMVKQAQLAPDQVLIEAYGEQVSLPAPEEIMDADTTQEPEEQVKDTEEPRPALVVNHPPVHEGNVDGEVEEQAEIDRLAQADEEACKKAIEKVEEHFPGSEVVSISKEGHPETFWEFMPWAQSKLRAAGKLDKYKEVLHSKGVKVLSETKDDPAKQNEVRVATEKLLESEGL